MNEEYNSENTYNNTDNTDGTDTRETTTTADVNTTEAEVKDANTVNAANTAETKTAESETAASEAPTADSTGTTEQAAAQAQPDPYSKYNFYQGNPYYQGYPNQGYTNQGYPYQGQQQNPQGIYNSTPPQYTGAYQSYGYTNPGYQNPAYGQNPYPTGRVSYVSNVDSIYPGTAPHKTHEKKEKSKAAKFFTGLAMSVAFGAVAAGVFILITFIYKQQNPELFNTNSTPVQVTTTETKKDNQLNLDPAEGTQIPSTSVIDGATFTGTDVSNVVEENMPAIVAIDCITQAYSYWYGPYEGSSAGSGIIIQKNSSELMIATNNHVISGTKDIKVKFIDGTSVPATVKGNDEVSDLAVLSVQLEDIPEETLNAIAIAKLGNSDEIKVGEMAIAIGNALGYGQSVTVGYVSAKDRELTIDGQKFTGLLQTDAAINPGNSGGALLNLNGEVIGINNAKIGGSDVEGMGYAIPISKAQAILSEYTDREVLAREEQGYLGISVISITSEIAKVYDWPTGAYISEVAEDSAAQKAGLLIGDIITKIDNLTINSNDTLVNKIQSLRYGTDVTVTLQRRIDGEFQELTYTVTLGQRPAESDETSSSAETQKPETKTPEDKAPEGKTPETNTPDDSDKETIYPDINRPDGFGNYQLPEDFDLSQLPDGFDPSQLPDMFGGNFPGTNNR